MFDGIFDAIEEWMRELLTGVINTNLDRMFTDVNQKTGEIAGQVGMTPENWNSSIFQMIHNLSDSVIVPIAGMIITFVLCYELISMVTEKNNMHDIDTWMFFKYFFKMWVAVYLVSHTFDITEINETQVMENERLTNEVYHYDSKEHVFERADKFKARKMAKSNMRAFEENTQKSKKTHEISL